VTAGRAGTAPAVGAAFVKELIYLSHRIPYPPNKGDKIRSWNLLKRLADRFTVHLATFVDDPDDWQHTGVLSDLCGETCFEPLNPLLAKVRASTGLVTGSSLTMPYYRSAAMARWVRDVLQRREVGGIVAFSSSMAQYLVDADRSVRRVVDFCDVDSDKWRQYAERFGGLRRWVYGREGRLLGEEERSIGHSIDASVLISDDEADLFREVTGVDEQNVHVVPNGVDVEFFDPAGPFGNPFENGSKPLVFVGAMDYWPNVDAVTWFANEVLPAALARNPGLEFFIVGGNPDPQVQSLASHPAVTVTGRVDDVRPFIRYAGQIVAPLRVARGVQNKVLEAMAMARPVLASPAAMEGIFWNGDSGIRICRSTEDWIAALAEPKGAGEGDAAGEALRSHVCRHFSWDASAGSLVTVINGSDRPARGREAGGARYG